MARRIHVRPFRCEDEESVCALWDETWHDMANAARDCGVIGTSEPSAPRDRALAALINLNAALAKRR